MVTSCSTPTPASTRLRARSESPQNLRGRQRIRLHTLRRALLLRKLLNLQLIANLLNMRTHLQSLRTQRPLGGGGIGGVLEPLQASPTIIEDNCFIGARSEIVEGVIVEEGSVISMGVFIGQSTKIFDRTTGEIYQGRVPAGSVVVSGSMPSKDGSHSLYCAVIVKRVDAQTREKTSVNELLRGI